MDHMRISGTDLWTLAKQSSLKSWKVMSKSAELS